MQLRAATRSALALWQARHVASQLECEIDEVVVSTVGDRNTDADPLDGWQGRVRQGGSGCRARRSRRLRRALREGPPGGRDGLVLVCVPARADAMRSSAHPGRRCLGAHIATGWFVAGPSWPGIGPTSSSPSCAATFRLGWRSSSLAASTESMAAAAIDRLALDLSIPVDRLDPAIMLPRSPRGPRHRVPCGRHRDGRGAACDQHADTRRVVDTERAFLHELGGDCDLPPAHTQPLGTTASRSPACWRRLMAGS